MGSTPVARIFVERPPSQAAESSVWPGLQIIPEKVVRTEVTLVRDEYFVEAVRALGHLLFKCAPVIETVVEQWMGRMFMSRKEDPIDMLKYVLSIVSTQRPTLQFRISRIVNFMSRPMARVCSISFFSDLHNMGAEQDFECDDMLLPVPIHQFDSSVSLDRVKARIALIISSIVSYDKRGGFMQHGESIGVQHALMSNFESDDILRESYDQSVYIVAILHHLLLHCEALTETDQDLGKLDSEAAEDEARNETVQAIMEVCDTFVREMRHHVPCLASPNIQLDDALLYYDAPKSSNKPDADCDHALCGGFIYGVPVAVICDARSTLLWLEAIWCAEGAINLRRLVSDLWRAKQLSITQDYFDFFQHWDEHELKPVIERIAQSLPDPVPARTSDVVSLATVSPSNLPPTLSNARGTLAEPVTKRQSSPTKTTTTTTTAAAASSAEVAAPPSSDPRPTLPPSQANNTPTVPLTKEEAMYLLMRETMQPPSPKKEPGKPKQKPASNKGAVDSMDIDPM